MCVRLVRFEGGNLDDVLAETEEIRRDVDAIKRHELTSYFSKELLGLASRVEVFMDRPHASVAIAFFCDSESTAEEVDRVMDAVSPRHAGIGTRVSRDIYEVILDEGLRMSGTGQDPG